MDDRCHRTLRVVTHDAARGIGGGLAGADVALPACYSVVVWAPCLLLLPQVRRRLPSLSIHRAVAPPSHRLGGEIDLRDDELILLKNV